MPFPLQHTKYDQAAHDMMPLCLCGARLTACAAERIFADADDFPDLRAHSIQPAPLRSRQARAIVGIAAQLQSLPSVRASSTREKPYTSRRSGLEKTHAKPSMWER
jgi:hypothetical protein